MRYWNFRLGLRYSILTRKRYEAYLRPQPEFQYFSAKTLRLFCFRTVWQRTIAAVALQWMGADNQPLWRHRQGAGNHPNLRRNTSRPLAAWEELRKWWRDLRAFQLPLGGFRNGVIFRVSSHPLVVTETMFRASSCLLGGPKNGMMFQVSSCSRGGRRNGVMIDNPVNGLIFRV